MIKLCNIFSRSQPILQPELENDGYFLQPHIQPIVLIYELHFLLQFLKLRSQLQFEIDVMILHARSFQLTLLNEPKQPLLQLYQLQFQPQYEIFLGLILFKFFKQLYQLQFLLF